MQYGLLIEAQRLGPSNRRGLRCKRTIRTQVVSTPVGEAGASETSGRLRRRDEDQGRMLRRVMPIVASSTCSGDWDDSGEDKVRQR
nr:uncharacterized protein CTRU02_02893 [Colletotrichum truncatum]KAF6797851.1 hypothetical protein CTRU02_02893 [Colletotrichum truncatum]